MSLVLVTDRWIVPGGDLVAAVSAVLRWLPLGAVTVQLDERDLSAREQSALARRLLPTCQERQARLLITDRVDVAMSAGANGVLVSQDGFQVPQVRRVWPSAVVGVRCHSAAQVGRAARMGADLALVGPIYPAPGAAGARGPLGLSVITAARELVGDDFELYGVGGVTTETSAQIIEAGATSVAAQYAVLGDLDPVAAASAVMRSCGVEIDNPPQLDSPLTLNEDDTRHKSPRYK